MASLGPNELKQSTQKTFMIHRTFVRWALYYILLIFVKSIIRHLGPAIGNVRCVQWFSWTFLKCWEMIENVNIFSSFLKLNSRVKLLGLSFLHKEEELWLLYFEIFILIKMVIWNLPPCLALYCFKCTWVLCELFFSLNLSHLTLTCFPWGAFQKHLRALKSKRSSI